MDTTITIDDGDPIHGEFDELFKEFRTTREIIHGENGDQLGGCGLTAKIAAMLIGNMVGDGKPHELVITVKGQRMAVTVNFTRTDVHGRVMVELDESSEPPMWTDQTSGTTSLA